MTQHTATNVLRVGNQMAIVVNMVLEGITCRLLFPHAQVVMVQGSQQQHWQEHCQQQLCGKATTMCCQIVHQ